MRISLKIIIPFAFGISACGRPAAVEDIPAKAKVSVQVVGLRNGIVKDELTLFANTLYLKRNVVTSPIPAFINRVFIKLGDPVKQGQLLYQLETKEHRALGSSAIISGSTSATFGLIVVRCPASGMISTLDKQQVGDYVMEGGPLCTIAESSALAFAVNVPFEFSVFAKAGKKCSLLLPDNSLHAATFTTPLTTMNALSQTQTVLAKADVPIFLPENLIVKVIVDKNTGKPQQVLPKACILSDEMLEKFWVMELVNDTTAVKVEVQLGNRNRESVEVLKPTFRPDARFLISGNYGLPDTAFVKVNR